MGMTRPATRYDWRHAWWWEEYVLTLACRFVQSYPECRNCTVTRWWGSA